MEEARKTIYRTAKQHGHNLKSASPTPGMAIKQCANPGCQALAAETGNDQVMMAGIFRPCPWADPTPKPGQPVMVDEAATIPDDPAVYAALPAPDPGSVLSTRPHRTWAGLDDASVDAARGLWRDGPPLEPSIRELEEGGWHREFMEVWREVAQGDMGIARLTLETASESPLPQGPYVVEFTPSITIRMTVCRDRDDIPYLYGCEDPDSPASWGIHEDQSTRFGLTGQTREDLAAQVAEWWQDHLLRNLQEALYPWTIEGDPADPWSDPTYTPKMAERAAESAAGWRSHGISRLAGFVGRVSIIEPDVPVWSSMTSDPEALAEARTFKKEYTWAGDAGTLSPSIAMGESAPLVRAITGWVESSMVDAPDIATPPDSPDLDALDAEGTVELGTMD